jgi:hypothetical protein
MHCPVLYGDEFDPGTFSDEQQVNYELAMKAGGTDFKFEQLIF